MIRRHWSLALCAATLALGTMLAAFVPHRSATPEAPSLAFRDHVIFDDVGLISPAFDSEKSGLLLQSEPLVQFLVYIAARPPQGDFENYTLETTSTWKIGSEHGDNGIVLFIFSDARKARLEVGYGPEGTLPDGATCSTTRSSPNSDAARTKPASTISSPELSQYLATTRRFGTRKSQRIRPAG